MQKTQKMKSIERNILSACSARSWRCLEVGYDAWRKRPMSQHDREDASIADQVKAAFSANRRVYGSPRLHAELRAQGIRCGQKRVARLMRVQGLAARRPRHRTVTTQGRVRFPVA